MSAEAITRAAQAIGEAEPAILESISADELRARTEQFAASMLALARQRKAEDMP